MVVWSIGCPGALVLSRYLAFRLTDGVVSEQGAAAALLLVVARVILLCSWRDFLPSTARSVFQVHGEPQGEGASEKELRQEGQRAREKLAHALAIGRPLPLSTVARWRMLILNIYGTYFTMKCLGVVEYTGVLNVTSGPHC